MNKPSAAAFALSFACIFSYAAEASKIYIVANASDKNSLKVAAHYAEARRVPAENIIRLKIPAVAAVDRKTYVQCFENPLVAELVKKKALNAIPLGRRENSGRDSYVLNSVELDCVVLCYGIPWRILPIPDESGGGKKISVARSDEASFDSELSARFLPDKGFYGPLKNPLYGKNFSGALKRNSRVIPVARLDGPSPECVVDYVDRTVDSEKKGLRGRIYIDKSKYYPKGDEWMDLSAQIFKKLGYDVEVEETKRLMLYGDRVDGMAVYFGWYSNRASGYFAEKNFKAAPGSFGLHIYSFSAADIRDGKAWVGALAKAGFSAAFGNSAEPFLFSTHQPHLLSKALSEGCSMVEAAMVSIPALSWQGIFVGDPLYRPFSKDLDCQLADIRNGKIDEYSQYAVLRKANLVKLGGGDACSYIKSHIGKMPDEALLFRIFESESADAEYREKIARELLKRDALKLVEFSAMASRLADFLETRGEDGAKEALKVYAARSKAEISEEWRLAINAKIAGILKRHPALNSGDYTPAPKK